MKIQFHKTEKVAAALSLSLLVAGLVLFHSAIVVFAAAFAATINLMYVPRRILTQIVSGVAALGIVAFAVGQEEISSSILLSFLGMVTAWALVMLFESYVEATENDFFDHPDGQPDEPLILPAFVNKRMAAFVVNLLFVVGYILIFGVSKLREMNLQHIVAVLISLFVINIALYVYLEKK